MELGIDSASNWMLFVSYSIKKPLMIQPCFIIKKLLILLNKKSERFFLSSFLYQLCVPFNRLLDPLRLDANIALRHGGGAVL